MAQPTEPRIVVALDFSERKALEGFVEQVDPSLCRLKVGKELFTSFGPEIVHWLQNKGFEIFLDLKFHDIPNTTAHAVKAAANMGVWMVNVHASGGRRMMEACREILQPFQQPPLLIAVTILTSLSDDELQEIGYSSDAEQMVKRLASLSKDSGMDGVVCSAQESAMLRSALGDDFALVTPGIRPGFAAKDDQTRIVTPAKAVEDGSHYLVIGRPITRADDPLKALTLIQQELNNGVA
ncbi:orotidine 5'-phosphate decarboxylase [Hahella sp. CCB-MM4]|uniref:orotidine-5'-phosphate decarboxylase n=1 Tax=Hahella sp. (strain CCB-MM4) TaxID=1926491 RepID=UPI000B9C0427|nr:orotidine-5'-phosphate decarboxylase [Hahella sp. CCB-MM4]OZG72203.1 orotidine 5'-phosphate decarboxylase [Hahella sp. CCB-MM4]